MNLAFLDYHFGSKKVLIDSVLARRLGPLDQERLEVLDRLEPKRDGENAALDQILYAFLGPALRFSQDPDRRGECLMRLMGQVHSESRDFSKVIL